MNTKATVVAGALTALLVVIVLLIRTNPATPPLAFTSPPADTAATATPAAAPPSSSAKKKAGKASAAASAAAADSTEQTIEALRKQVDEFRALLKAGGGGAAAAAPIAPLTSAAVPGPRPAACPQCDPCLAQKCPPATTAAAVPAASAVPAFVGGGSGDAKARCEKFKLDFPPEIKRLTLQVGPHMSPLQSEGADHAVITFEPQAHIAHHIAEQRRPRVYAVPAAVSLYDGLAMFDLAEDHSQSASLNAFNPKIASWSGRKVLVPVLRLQTVLECLDRTRFPFVEYFLCDAQGSDLDVVKSAGAELRRFRKIELEVQVNKFAYYQSDNSKAAVVKYMTSMGFREVASHCNGVDPAVHARDPTICEEENVTFVPV